MCKLYVFLFSILFFSYGCATESNYKKIVDTWLGLREVELIRNWGAPQQTYESGGSRFLVYSSGGSVYLPGSQNYTTNFIGNTAYTTGYSSPGFNIPVNCTTTFEVLGGIVTSYNFRGNNCVSK